MASIFSLVSLLIVVSLIVWFSAQLLTSSKSQSSTIETIENQVEVGGSVENILAPIDDAEEVKNLIESRNR